MQGGVQTVAAIDFTDKGNFAEFSSDGFSVLEYFGAWSLGSGSQITIPASGLLSNLTLNLTIQPFIIPDLNTPQSLSITVGDRDITTYWSQRAEWVTLSFYIPGTISVPPEGLRIAFSHPSPAPALALAHSSDLRPLAFMFQTLTLTGAQNTPGEALRSGVVAGYSVPPEATEESAVNELSALGAADANRAETPEIIELILAQGGNGVGCLGDGWSTPESHGAWTIGPESALFIPGLDAGFDYRCSLPLDPFLHPPELPAQALRITANGVELLSEMLHGARRVEFVIPAAVINQKQPVDLVLHCATPTAPNSFRNDPDAAPDSRALGFAIWGLSLWQVPPAPYILPSPAVSLTPPPPKVAAVTMVYNESVYLPIWLKHNAQQVGIENCYVVDHGSTDGSTDNLGACNVVRIPRSPYDPAKQSAWNSDFCNSLLNWFDFVIYSDVDEILMADPAVAPTLIEYCRRPLPDVVTAIGLNTLHLIDDEAPLDLSQPVSTQRPYVFACASMCKPLLIHRKVKWSPGSHSSDAKLKFDHLYMFHLRWFDQPLGLERLHKTRAMAWAQDDQGQHQRLADAELEAQMRGFGAHQRLDIEFNPDVEPMSGFLRRVEASTIGREDHLYKIDLDIWHNQLWRMPQRFIGTF